MYKYIYAAAIILPLLGIFLMQKGAYGISVGVKGYENGALVVFSLYALISLLVFFLLKKKTINIKHSREIDSVRFRRYCTRVIFFNFILVAIMLFVFDAHNVWSGNIGKGEFRVSLGGFGFLAFLCIKYLAPLALAYGAFLYLFSSKGLFDKGLLAIALFVGIVLGTTWGYKATGITIILPAVLILFWSTGFLSVAIFSVFALITIIILSFVFDGSGSIYAAISALWLRLTVIQGDVSWYVWGLYSSGVEFPEYAQTLLASLGDRFLENVYGLNRENYEEWVSYHYDLLLNQVAGLPASASLTGHTIVGTPFTEGLIMGGFIGVICMALLSGILSAFVFNKINSNLCKGRGMACAFWATYFCVFLFPWLRGGALVQLFHVSLIVGFTISFLVVFLMAKLILYRKLI